MKLPTLVSKGLVAVALVAMITAPARAQGDDDPSNAAPWGQEEQTAAATNPTTPKAPNPKPTKAPVNATCPITLRFPNTQVFTQGEGGFITLKVINPYTQPITNLKVNYTFPSGSVGATPNAYRNTGGFFAYPPGTNVGGNRRAQKARSSRNAPEPQISPNRRTVTYDFGTIPPKTAIIVVVTIKIEPGVTRTNTLQAQGYYTYNNVNCRPASNQYVVSTRIMPITTLSSTSNGKTSTYQQFASVYRICATNISNKTYTTPQDCAALCDADKTCTSFVMSPPTKLDQNNQTCRLYDVTWGNTLTYGGVAGNDTAGFNSTGSTIYLKRSKPVGLFGASPCAGP